MKSLYVDVETTGIQPDKHAVIQIAALLTEDSGEIQDQIIFNVAPPSEAQIDLEALQVNGKTLEEVQSYPPVQEQLEIFTSFLRKYISPYDKKDKLLFLAYNAPFDVEFVRRFFLSGGDRYFGSYFWNPAIDIMTLAMQELKAKRPDMPNFKLSTVAQALAIPVSDTELHDAHYDILLAYKIHQKLYPPIPSSEVPKKTSPSFSQEEYKDTLF